MEVSIPSLPLDFNFSSAASSPYPSPPSTPKPFGQYYCSAPTSPSRLSQFYRDFDSVYDATASASNENPGGSAARSAIGNNGDDFEFGVMSEDWETASVSADELFDGGVIKPMNPPTKLTPSPLSQTKRLIKGALSPRQRSSRKESDDVSIAVTATRGRERSVNSVTKSTSRRAARSLSPLRDTRNPWEEQVEEDNDLLQRDAKSSSQSSKSGHKKWRLMDFFLFRSASEGRSSEKDPLKKYTEAVRHSSFRVIEKSGSGSGSGSRRKGRVSAHELHYKTNRAVSEDLKKKSFLPYKQGILGRLAFNPAVHAMANGFGFSRNK